MSDSDNITNLESLKRAQDKLRVVVELKEKELSSSFNHFKSNHRSILWSYINPFKGGGGNNFFQSSILPILLGGGVAAAGKSSIVPILLNDSVRTLLIRTGLNLFKKILPKKKTKTDKEEEETK